jgi:hypothetical protein
MKKLFLAIFANDVFIGFLDFALRQIACFRYFKNLFNNNDPK